MSHDALKIDDLEPRAKDISPKAAHDISGGIIVDTSLGTQVAVTTPSVTSGSTTVATKIKVR